MLTEIINNSSVHLAILNHLSNIQNAATYLGAGSIAQLVWNRQHGYHPTTGINDWDIVYYEPMDRSAYQEKVVAGRLQQYLGGLNLDFDVVNQARVHLWYEEAFGKSIEPYSSIDHAISTWPTTATAIAVRLAQSELEIIAPFGLDDLLTGVVRPNKAQITQDIYANKVAKWQATWPSLQYLPWND